ncbi:hypothetical protein LTR36_007435 [Oleoguttula mirabilis]|uniref:Uncharacterized protein n=1 Tax=Oleoguttula mirabilis TaxID=1507867 RepID=A0AAV9JAA9_9PEZI|nr:hypothetical protein LTR36_007435 [Oleoguttula mirabilis]
MSSIFCCNKYQPHRSRTVDHEAKFRALLSWAQSTSSSPIGSVQSSVEEMLGDSSSYAVQVVQQVNFGPVETRRYFVADAASDTFTEISERDLVDANYKKVNSYKNFKCALHNKYFELNMYQKDPLNKHHWRADIARPAGKIDL